MKKIKEPFMHKFGDKVQEVKTMFKLDAENEGRTPKEIQTIIDDIVDKNYEYSYKKLKEQYE